MERSSSKSKSKILRLLPKAAKAAAVSFQNPPFSPAREKPKSHLHKGFSGPIISMFPAEARETQEPTSPKISCMGQIKHKNKVCKMKQASLPRELKPEKIEKARLVGPDKLKKKPSGIKKIFSGRRKSDDSDKLNHGKPPLPDRAPSISQMRRFASSRDTLASFDWTTAQITPEYGGDSYSDEDRAYSDGEDDVMIPFSAPLLMIKAGAGMVGGLALEPRKEINLWKRRTMAQPQPLQLNVVRA